MLVHSFNPKAISFVNKSPASEHDPVANVLKTEPSWHPRTRPKARPMTPLTPRGRERSHPEIVVSFRSGERVNEVTTGIILKLG